MNEFYDRDRWYIPHGERTVDELAALRDIDFTVYEPAADSYLLLAATKHRISPGDRVLDVGTGTGFVASRLTQEQDITAYAVDINPFACRRASQNGIETVRGDLTSAFRADSFDVVVCNPPYLPAEQPDSRSWLDVAIEGGESGREILEQLIPDIPRVLRASGTCYVIVSSHMGIDKVIAFAEDYGLTVERLDTDDSYPDETLGVLALSIQ